MDFSTWSPSHTILLLGMIFSTIVTAIVQVCILFYRVNKLEERMDRTNDRIDKVKDEISDRISEVKAEITNDRNQNQATWMDLNQHLINHLRDHSNPHRQSQPSTEISGMPDFEEFQRWRKSRGEPSNDW